MLKSQTLDICIFHLNWDQLNNLQGSNVDKVELENMETWYVSSE